MRPSARSSCCSSSASSGADAVGAPAVAAARADTIAPSRRGVETRASCGLRDRRATAAERAMLAVKLNALARRGYAALHKRSYAYSIASHRRRESILVIVGLHQKGLTAGVGWIGKEARQALDLPHLCGPFDGAGFERALSQEPRQGPDRPLGRLRSADPDRLRQRSSARQGRGRQGRRADLASRRHARAVRRHPARRDEHLDDHQRDRRLAARALRRARRRAGRRARRSSPAPRRTTSSRNISRAAPTCFRRRPPCG